MARVQVVPRVVRRAAGGARDRLARALASSGWAGRFLGILPGRAAVLMYHSVDERPLGQIAGRPQAGAEAVTRFAAEMAFLREQMNPVPLSWLAEQLGRGGEVAKRTVAVTFDDGYADNYEVALPVLRRYGVPATVFLTTGHVGTARSFWWDRLSIVLAEAAAAAVIETRPPGSDAPLLLDLGSAEARRAAAGLLSGRLKRAPGEAIESYIDGLERQLGVASTACRGPKALDWEQVRRMASEGVEFGAHTVTHANLAQLPPERAVWEIRQSKAAIEVQLGEPVRAFAYPFGLRGDYSGWLADQVRESGVSCCCTAVRGAVGRRTSTWELPRVSLLRSSLGETVAALIGPLMAAR